MIALGNHFPPAAEYPVFIKAGDAREEVDEVARNLGTTAADAGLHKLIYAQRAGQTVVLVTARDTPLAKELRARGWTEPEDPPEGSA